MTDETVVRVKAKNIHMSQVLPPRNYASDIAESVKSCGSQQPLIVRPVEGRPDEYDLIDGHGRLEALDPEEDVLVDVRSGLSDVDVFRISEATSKRTQKTAYENAVFYAAYVDAVTKAKGEKGAIATVAAEALISESQLSQYLAINGLFHELKEKKPETEFEKLKTLGLNRLYELSKSREDSRLAEIALEVEEKADALTAEGIKQLAETTAHPTSEQETVTVDADTESASPASASEPAKREDTDATTLATVPNKLAILIEELSLLLPQTNLQELCQTNSDSPEASNAIQKMTISLRRFIFYLKKLKKTLKTPPNSGRMLKQEKS